MVIDAANINKHLANKLALFHAICNHLYMHI